MHNCHHQILAAKKKDPNADTSALEHEIDKMLYDIYEVRDDEIKIVPVASYREYKLIY